MNRFPKPLFPAILYLTGPNGGQKSLSAQLLLKNRCNCVNLISITRQEIFNCFCMVKSSSTTNILILPFLSGLYIVYRRAWLPPLGISQTPATFIPPITFFIIFHSPKEHKAGNMNNRVGYRSYSEASYAPEERGPNGSGKIPVFGRTEMNTHEKSIQIKNMSTICAGLVNERPTNPTNNSV